MKRFYPWLMLRTAIEFFSLEAEYEIARLMKKVYAIRLMMILTTVTWVIVMMSSMIAFQRIDEKADRYEPDQHITQREALYIQREQELVHKGLDADITRLANRVDEQQKILDRFKAFESKADQIFWVVSGTGSLCATGLIAYLFNLRLRKQLARRNDALESLD